MAFVGDDGTLYLDSEDVLAAYAEVCGCSAEQAADQLRSRAALEGALARPLQHAHYGGADLALQAAVLAQGIAETQPFIDGNKRVALAAMRAFLLANGFAVTASQAERAEWMLELSDGLNADELAAKLRDAMIPAAGEAAPTEPSDGAPPWAGKLDADQLPDEGAWAAAATRAARESPPDQGNFDRCGQCDMLLPHDLSAAEARQPCPRCGGMTRNYSRSVSDTL